MLDEHGRRGVHPNALFFAKVRQWPRAGCPQNWCAKCVVRTRGDLERAAVLGRNDKLIIQTARSASNGLANKSVRSAHHGQDFGISQLPPPRCRRRVRNARKKREAFDWGVVRGLTFELSGRHRVGAWPAKRMMTLAGSRAKCQAGGGPLERRVRSHSRHRD